MFWYLNLCPAQNTRLSWQICSRLWWITSRELAQRRAEIRINLQRTGSFNGFALPINAITTGVKVWQGPNQERSQLLNVLQNMSLSYEISICLSLDATFYSLSLAKIKWGRKFLIKIRNFVQQFYPATILYICQSFNLILTLIVVKWGINKNFPRSQLR